MARESRTDVTIGVRLGAAGPLLGAIERGRLSEALQADAGALDQSPEMFAVDFGEARRHGNVATRRLEHAGHEVSLELEKNALAEHAISELPRFGTRFFTSAR